MKATVRWLGEASFLGETGSGHTVVMDGPEASGGRNIGIRPMEMMLLGVGGCSAFDVVSILSKSRQRVSDCVAEVSAVRADSVPAVFEKIHLRFRVRGRELNEKQVARAVSLSAEKYCSATLMLDRGGVKVTHDYVIEESTGEEAR